MKKNRNDVNIIGKVSAVLTGMGAAVLVFAAFCAGLVAFASALSGGSSSHLELVELPSAFINKASSGGEVASADLVGLKFKYNGTEYSAAAAGDITGFSQLNDDGDCKATIGGKNIFVYVDDIDTNTYYEARLALKEGDDKLRSDNSVRFPKTGYTIETVEPFEYALRSSDNTAWIIKYSPADPVDTSSEPEVSASPETSATPETSSTPQTAVTPETSSNAGQATADTVIEITSPITVGGRNYNVVGVDSFAFVYSDDIVSFTAPDTLKTIGDFAFSSCNNLKTVDPGDGLTEIGDYAFLFCKELNSVDLPESLTDIGSDAFAGCSKLKNMTIPAFVNDLDGDETLPKGASITGAKNSAAQRYCNAHPENNYTFHEDAGKKVVAIPVEFKGYNAEVLILGPDDTTVAEKVVPYSDDVGCCYLDPDEFDSDKTYKIIVSRPGYTTCTLSNFTSDKTIPDGKIKIYPGNLSVNGDEPDGKVGLDDVAELSKVYGTTTDDGDDFLEEADFNDDGTIDMMDVSLLIDSGGYNKSSGTVRI